MLKQLYKFTALLLVGSFIIMACDNGPTSMDNDEPPQLPPVESMETDFSVFDNNENKIATEKQNNINFAQAAARALLIKSIVDLNLAIPRVLLKAASNAEVEFNEDGEWEWRFTKQAGNSTYEVRLLATRESEDEINWQFFITNSSLGIDNRLFFSGTSNGDGTQGTWTYYDLQSSEEQPVSTIEWTITDEDDISLRLEILSNRFNNEGDVIEYTFDGTVKYLNYLDAGDDEMTEIEWNTETKAGFLIAPNYNNGEKACWDENLQDISCSEI
jgi:hypothetical protein